MAYIFKSPAIGLTPIATTTAAPTVAANMGTVAAGTLSSSPGPAGRSTAGRLGAIATAYDPTFGEGEFIYLLGVVGTVVGSLVTYNATTFQTTIRPTTTNNSGPVAVAMSANVAGQYGWYCIEGLVPIKKTAVQVLPGAKIYQSSTAGRISVASVAGMQILGARGANLTTVTSTTSTVVVLINRPSGQNSLV